MILIDFNLHFHLSFLKHSLIITKPTTLISPALSPLIWSKCTVAAPSSLAFHVWREGEEIYAKSWPTLKNNLQQQAFLVKQAILWPSLIPSTAPLAQSRASTFSMTKTTLDCHGHGHFSKSPPFPEPPRHMHLSPLLEPYQARPMLFRVPIVLSRACSDDKQIIEHLAGIGLAPSPKVERHPLDLSSHHRTRLTPLDMLAQPLVVISPF
jgi:hypothetical protein